MRVTLPAKPRALDRLRERRAVVCQRAVLLGADEVAGLVLARVVDHGAPGVTMPPGTVLLEAWGGNPAELERAVSRRKPMGVRVLVVHHAAAGLLQRAIAWSRWTLYRVRRAFRR